MIPAAPPSDLYADASHPLTKGYPFLAAQLLEDESFHRFHGIQQGHDPGADRP